jgi:hypothetical protein
VTRITTSGKPATADRAMFRDKIHSIRSWKQHPYRRDMVVPILACGSTSKTQFPSPIDTDWIAQLERNNLRSTVDCQRCLVAR